MWTCRRVLEATLKFIWGTEHSIKIGIKFYQQLLTLKKKINDFEKVFYLTNIIFNKSMVRTTSNNTCIE